MAEDVKLYEKDQNFELDKIKFYLPPSIGENVPYLKNMLYRYLETEFPNTSKTAVYSIPKTFSKQGGEKQASRAEELVFQRFRNLSSLNTNDLWMIFFHNASYAGYSNRNQRLGKLMIREHDFVVFIKYGGQHFVLLVEVKSTNDRSTIKENLELTADAKIIKNNKRSAQHQLRDHMEILQNGLGYDVSKEIQCYIMWPFLGAYTKDPKHQVVKRWMEDKNLHVFEHVISEQKNFNEWFLEILSASSCKESTFAHLLTRYIILSCGVFMEEIDRNLLALLTQQQLELLNNDICKREGSLVVHGIAGTGKTLLILKKLQLLHENNELNEDNRALYICYWPGIRCDVENKLKHMGIDRYVDTIRFFITSRDFLKDNKNKYKHIFMDEAEASILSFNEEIVQNTFYRIYKAYHNGNCSRENCALADVEAFKQHSISKLIKLHIEQKITWGELWFMVDTNQTLMFLPKHSPDILKTPQVVLNKLIRSTKKISCFFGNVTNNLFSDNEINFPKSAKEPPIFWVQRGPNITQTVSEVLVDLCSTKGIKPSDICVIPFLQNEMLSKEAINSQICQKFVENAFKPEGVSDVENFLISKAPNEFLIAWALRVKGLEFKVVIMVIDEDQFDKQDPDDRRKIYVIASRSTCMLVIISDDNTKNTTDLNNSFEDYSFNIKFGYEKYN